MLLKTRDLTRIQVARAMNVPYQKALRWMMLPSSENLAILEEAAYILDVCPQWLENGTGDPARTVRRVPLYNLSNSRNPINNVIAMTSNETARILINEPYYLLPENSVLSLGNCYTPFVALRTDKEQILLANSDGNDNLALFGDLKTSTGFELMGYIFNLKLR